MALNFRLYPTVRKLLSMENSMECSLYLLGNAIVHLGDGVLLMVWIPLQMICDWVLSPIIQDQLQWHSRPWHYKRIGCLAQQTAMTCRCQFTEISIQKYTII